MNKIKMFAAAAALLSAPVILSSCANGTKDDTLPPKREVTAPIQLESADPENEPELKTAEPVREQTAEPVSAAEAEEAGKPLPVPEEAEKPEPVKLPCSHTVKTNDSLWRLAAHYYGRGSQWKVIYEANRNLISKPDRLEPGTVLNIPALPAQQ